MGELDTGVEVVVDTVLAYSLRGVKHDLFVILEQRETKKEKATAYFERATKFSKSAGTRAITDELREKSRRLREEVKQGNYALEMEKSSQNRTQRFKHIKTPQVQRDDGWSL